MADSKHSDILKKGTDVWNTWREENPEVKPDFKGEDLDGLDLSGANLERSDLRNTKLREANLDGASLRRSDLRKADLTDATLRDSNLRRVILSWARLHRADLSRANLRAAYMRKAELVNASLNSTNLKYAMMVGTDLTGADLSNSKVYGASAWDIRGIPKSQHNLIIEKKGDYPITVDDLKIAHFIYLLIDNDKLRDIISTVTSKTVLILGRFSDPRKEVLDALRDELRKHELVPVIFDFEPSKNRKLEETVKLLANISKFVIADVTDAKSIPQELASIVPFLPSVPVRPIILNGQTEYALFEQWEGYNSMLPLYRYENAAQLIENIEKAILEPIAKWQAKQNKEALLRETIAARDEEIARLKAQLSSNLGSK